MVAEQRKIMAMKKQQEGAEDDEARGNDDGVSSDGEQSEDEQASGPIQNSNQGSNKVFSNAKYIINENGQYERIVRKRKRKSSEQLRTLMREFEKNPNWSKETLLEISRKSGLSEAQVYKWGWDQKRKKFGPEIANLMD